MADLMQQARELLATHYDAKFLGGVTGEMIRANVADGVIPTREALQVVAAALRAAPEGFVMVPVKPTPEMLAAVGNGADGLKRRIWRGMLAARPQGVR